MTTFNIPSDTEFSSIYESLKGFVEFTSVYPPAELYAGNYAPTPKEKKHEQRCVEICEELYSLECDILREFRRSFRELEVQYTFFKNLKPDNLIHAFANFEFHFTRAKKALAAMHKKDPVLNAYFQQHNVDLPMPLLHYVFHDWARVQKPMIGKKYSIELKAQKEAHK